MLEIVTVIELVLANGLMRRVGCCGNGNRNAGGGRGGGGFPRPERPSGQAAKL